MGYEQPQAPFASGTTVTEIQNATYTYAADAEANDSYAITLSEAPDSYAEGQTFKFKANTANTGAASLNVNGLGAKTIKKNHDQDLEDGDIESGSIVEVTYDGTNFQMVSVSAVTKVDAAASSTDNAIPRFDGTGGGVIQNSGVIITDSDQVGINETSPAAMLHITNDQASLTELRIDNSDASGSMALKLFDGSNERGQVHYDTAAALLNVGTNISSGQLSLSSNQGTEAVRIDSDGEMGVGTSTPDRRLHAEVDDASNSSVTQIARLTHTTSGTPAAGIGAGAEFEVETAADNNEIGATIVAVATDVTGGAEDFDLRFNTMAAGAAAAERLRINNLGLSLDGGTTSIGSTELNLLDGMTGKTGSDANFVTGTAGSNGNVAEWNSDGDVVDSGTNLDSATRTIVLSGAGGWASTTSGATAQAQTEFTTNDVDLVELEYADGSTTHAQWSVFMPDNYDGGTVTAKFYWRAATSTGNVVWGIQGIAYGDDEAIDTAWGTRQTVTDGAGSANNDVMISGATSAVTLAGTPAGGEMVQFRVSRIGGDAGDDLGVSAFLIAVKLEYGINAYSD